MITTIDDELKKDMEKLRFQIAELRHNLYIVEKKLLTIMYSFGYTDKELADGVGVSLNFVGHWRLSEGLPAYVKHKQKMTNEEKDQIEQAKRRRENRELRRIY